MAKALQMAFMRCMGCGIEFDESRHSETVGGPDLGETVIECPRPLAGDDGPWWAEPTATFEFEKVPSHIVKFAPEQDSASHPQASLPTLGPRLGLPPRLPLPLVEEEKANHWPLDSADRPSARRSLAGSLAGRHEEAKTLDMSPDPCKENPGSSSVSTRSSSSRFPSSSSTSLRSGGFDETTPTWRRSRSRLQTEERRPIVCPAIKWRISIDKIQSKASIGLDLADLPTTKDREGALRIRSVLVPGIVSDWNGAHRNKEVKKGDYIVEVNGVHGGPEELREVLERDAFLDVMMMRGT